MRRPSACYLIEYLGLIDQEAEAGKAVKGARRLQARLSPISDLNEDDIKTLVVDDKWLATLRR